MSEDYLGAAKASVSEALSRLPEDATRHLIADTAAEAAYRTLAKRFGKVYKELATKVAELEKLALKEKAERKDKANQARLVTEYHTILLKKYKLLVTPEELQHHLNGYDKNLKFDLSDDYSPTKKKNNDQDLMLDELKKKIDTTPQRHKEKANELDPNMKKQIEESHRKLQEKVALKELNTKKEKDDPKHHRDKDSHYNTLDLEDSKDLGPIKKSTAKPGREYGFSADLSQIEKVPSPRRKNKRDNPNYAYAIFTEGVMIQMTSRMRFNH